MNGLTELAITGPLLIAALVAAAAGAVSFASPCCIPLVPGYLAYLAGLAGTTSSTNPCPTPAVISGGGPANDSAPSTGRRRSGSGGPNGPD